MELCSIASGSSGNCIYVGTDATHLLVDVGISGKKTEGGLNSIGQSLKNIDGILVTHEHSDHICGLGVLSRKYHIPIFATRGTIAAIKMSSSVGKIEEDLFVPIKADESFRIKDITVEPMRTSHDAAEPVAYRMRYENKKIAIATDLGTYNEYTVECLKGMDLLFLEANHDVNMLEIGNYPLPLKRRIRGKLGHLSNDDAAMAAEFLVKLGTEKILLGHLSEENNYPELAMQTVLCGLDKAGIKVGEDVLLDVASREKVVTI